MDLRAYARAKSEYDSTPMNKRPKTKLMGLVSEITMGIARDEIQRRLAEANDSNKS